MLAVTSMDRYSQGDMTISIRVTVCAWVASLWEDNDRRYGHGIPPDFYLLRPLDEEVDAAWEYLTGMEDSTETPLIREISAHLGDLLARESELRRRTESSMRLTKIYVDAFCLASDRILGVQRCIGNLSNGITTGCDLLRAIADLKVLIRMHRSADRAARLARLLLRYASDGTMTERRFRRSIEIFSGLDDEFIGCIRSLSPDPIHAAL